MAARELASLRVEALSCARCDLALARTQVVFGEGDQNAAVMLVGEAPGKDEDLEGRPFWGAAGQNLEGFLTDIGLCRAQVYIANVVMCRPPGNRPPRAREVKACASYLDDLIRLVGPGVIIALGARPTKRFLGLRATIGGTRGHPHRVGQAMVVPTYHPSPLSLNRARERAELVRADFRLALSLAYDRK
jgi:uracil-DNA glycosylase